MAVIANQLIKKQAGKRRSFLVAASTTIYEGSFVFLNVDGYADNATALGVNGFAGIAIEYVDNSSGSAGERNVEVWTDGDFELVGSGFSQADVASIVYAEDNYTIGLSISTASVPIGTVERYVSSTRVIVSIKPVGPGALPVAPLTTITPADAAGTPDYAIAGVTNSNGWGFASAAEAITFLHVIKNLQQRVLDLEARRK